MHPHTLIVISDALDDLAEPWNRGSPRSWTSKFFCGFSFAEIAAMRDVSERTVQRSWEKARLYLHHAIAAARSAP